MTAPRYGGWAADRNSMSSEVTPLDTRGPKRLWSQGPGYVVRRRGATDEPVELEYMCPVHGRFTARVSKTDTPDEVACESAAPSGPFAQCDECMLFHPTATGVITCECGRTFDTTPYCGLTSPWSPSTVSVWKSAGEVTG